MFKVVAVVVLLGIALGKPEADLVQSIPNVGTYMQDFKFAFYSGYLDVTGSSKKLHYIFTESQNDPATDPLVLWFNGGPGCSSLLGYIQENGPFVIENGQFMPYKNPYSWNTNASVFYIEQPAGVGFSLCPVASECVFNDETSADDNLLGVQSWFAKFPEYKNHDFYITGESYGGIYIPFLAKRILDYNKDAQEKINLKGFAIGNGVTDWRYDTTPAFLEMGFYHGLIGWDVKDGLDSNDCYSNTDKAECQPYIDKFNKLVEDLNPYDVYNWHYKDMPVTNPDYARFLDERFKKGMRAKLNSGLLKANPGYGIDTYLNTQEFRDAFHIDPSANTWGDCADINYTIQDAGSIGLYKTDFPGQGLRMLHYSGDTDGVVATLGTINWITAAGYNVTHEWAPWYTADQQVAGYFQGYEGLNFTTVHGTGHMVPQWKRVQAHQMIMNFLRGENFNMTYSVSTSEPRSATA